MMIMPFNATITISTMPYSNSLHHLTYSTDIQMLILIVFADGFRDDSRIR